MWFTRKKILYNFKIFPSLNSSVFWHITPCSPVKVNGCFGGTHRLHLQGRGVSRARNQAWCLLHVLFFLGLFVDTEDGGNMFLQNVGWLSPECTALSQKTELCVTTVVKPSTPSFTSLISLQTEVLLLLLLLPFKCVTKLIDWGFVPSISLFNFKLYVFQLDIPYENMEKSQCF
jgi:hypothetical protein